MNTAYLIWILCAIVAAMAVLWLSLQRQSRALLQCLLTGVLGTALGLVGAKLVYYLAMLPFMLANGWLKSLVDMRVGTFSYYGGVAGFCLGTALSAKHLHKRPMDVLNTFAPAGLLLAALARFGEYFLGNVGVRDMLYWEVPEQCFFPLAVTNEYGEWAYAVFMLEGLLTLGVLVLCVTRLKQHRFMRSLFYLCLIQILCESLRSDSMTWLFVKVEQLLCMLGLLTILVITCLRTPHVKLRWLPVGNCVLCAGLFVAVEFALDGKIPLPHFLCYPIMIVGIVALGLNEAWAMRRVVRHELAEAATE